MTERELGDRWVATREQDGAWIFKLPASHTAGIPDWCLMLGIVQLWEAKRIRPGKVAYCPHQLTAAQRFFIRMVARYAPTCGGVLLLGEDGFMEVEAPKALRPVAAATFHVEKEPYR